MPIKKAISLTDLIKNLPFSDLNEECLPKDKPQKEKYIVPNEEALYAFIKLRQFVDTIDKMRDATDAFEALLPKEEEKKPTFKDFLLQFFEDESKDVFKIGENIFPISIGLISIYDFFNNKKRFIKYNNKEIVDKKIDPLGSLTEEPVNTTIKVGNKNIVVPQSEVLFLNDKKLNFKLFVVYNSSNGLSIKVETGANNQEKAKSLINELKDSVFKSPYFKGQILELDGGSFEVVELPEQRMPSIDKNVAQELDKNIISLFNKTKEFNDYRLPLRRAVILEGQTGCGKSMISRYVAQSLKGKVTTLWITSKTINSSHSIAAIFDLARKLSPCLVVMEDLDLISGSRSDDPEILGEMLNQLDGLLPNESIVLIASTNCIRSLDSALNNRPGRFDRIFHIGTPSPEIAEEIAKYYLKEHNVSEEIINQLSLSDVKKGGLSGAQIVEVCKGAIIEAIHRNIPINDLCFKSSYRGISEQRKLVTGE